MVEKKVDIKQLAVMTCLSHQRSLFSGTKVISKKWSFLIVVVVLLVIFEFMFNLMIHFDTTSGIASLLRTMLYTQTITSANEQSFYKHLYNSEATPRLPHCPLISRSLQGPFAVDKHIYSYKDIEDNNWKVKPGGRWWPSNCTSRHHVAIIIPYRDRPSHLKIFLSNMHHFLQRQELDYGIYVVEPIYEVKFNRAMLFNIGYAESLKYHNYTCFIFHDVDLIPEDDRNLYSCPEMPRHMSVAIDKFSYKLPYTNLFGGVSALTKDQFIKVNGFSNKYFGWGGEDDDMFKRIYKEKFNIMRYSSDIARYKMMSHVKDVPNPQRNKLLRASNLRYKTDGLNSLKYKLLKTELRKLFTWILVDINEKEIMEDNTENRR